MFTSSTSHPSLLSAETEGALETGQSCVCTSAVRVDFSGVVLGFGRLPVLARLVGVMLLMCKLGSTDGLRTPGCGIVVGDWNRLMMVDSCVEMTFMSC